MKHAGALFLFEISLAFLMIAIGIEPDAAPFWAILGPSVVIVVVPVLWRGR